jgi:hypothetical protein
MAVHNAAEEPISDQFDNRAQGAAGGTTRRFASRFVIEKPSKIFRDLEIFAAHNTSAAVTGILGPFGAPAQSSTP